ncbi:MAG TPA: hypothetical protein DIU15_09410 [Deltaproteobacteria bacterium]|nr:hypothetical protein [Deltaproteobacteria bacterium]HCP46248.1 hypothetical protein [Deltaproteobacteria bacterium]
MVAFRNAVELGVPFVELDVRTCATGELVVIHDETLGRVAGVDVTVRELSLSELQSMDVGSHFDPALSACRVPTLLEVFESLRDDLCFNVEVKEESLRGDGTALGVGRLIHSMGLYSKTIVSSFNVGSLRRVRGLCHAPLALIYPGAGGTALRNLFTRSPWTAPLVSPYALHPRETLVDAQYVKRAHLRGLAINTWTVNTAERIREMVLAGVSGIITDQPGLALEIVAELEQENS